MVSAWSLFNASTCAACSAFEMEFSSTSFLSAAGMDFFGALPALAPFRWLVAIALSSGGAERIFYSRSNFRTA